MKIAKSVTELIGKTPLLALNNYCEKNNLDGKILAKLEYFNPSGSVKDRAALWMIEDAEKRGLINKDTLIIEPTSGNTGIGLAAIAASRGYKIVLTMPETMSTERRKLLMAYGADLVLTDGAKGMDGAIARAKELSQAHENSFIPSQFTNSANPNAHFQTTGPEIWEETEGKIDIFVAGVGTGGTLTGTGKFLKEKNPKIKVVAVEPANSPMLLEGRKGPHKIQGIGAGFIPEILDKNIFDEIITVKDEDAINTAKDIVKTEGVFVGISSGAALFAANQIAKRPENKGKTVVTIFPDTGERYLSMWD